MSKGDWSFLEQLLEEGQEYSTGIGRVWLTVLFLFRILVLGTAAESAWDDEQSGFICNTLQPGCTAVCYDKAFPISHFRYFVLQIIFVSTPTIFYFGYVAIRARKTAVQDEKEEEKKKQERRSHGGAAPGRLEVILEKDEEKEEEEKDRKAEGGRGKQGAAAKTPMLKGKLLGAYAVSILLKLVLEAGFIVGLWFLYGFRIPARYECRRDPCPHTVDCFVSRPTEKTIFTIYIQAMSIVSILLNVLELFGLLQRAVTHHLEKRYRNLCCQEQIRARHFSKTPSPLETSGKSTPAPAYEERGHQYLPVVGEGEFPQPAQCYPSEEWAVGSGSGETQGSMGLTGDLLPSYVNCISSMRPLANGGHHNSKHQQHQQKVLRQSKRSKHAHHKAGDLKHKHYV